MRWSSPTSCRAALTPGTSTSTASTTRANGTTRACASCSPRRGLKLVEWPEKAAGRLPAAGPAHRARDARRRAAPRHLQRALGRRPGAAAVVMPAPPQRAALDGRAGAALGARELAFGASIVAVRVWPADQYTRVTIESDEALVARHTLIDNPERVVIDIDGPRAEPRAARTGRQGARRRSVHRRRARRPEPAARGAPRHRPEAADRAAGVHPRAGRRLPQPAGVRPASDACARSAAGAPARQGARRGAGGQGR